MIGEMDHQAYLELLAGEALDDLDPTEVARLSAHRDGCAICAETATDLDDTLVALAVAVPQRPAPAGLEARIMAAVAAEPRTSPSVAMPEPAAAATASAPTPVSSRVDEPRSRWSAFRDRWAVAAVGATAVALVLVIVGASLATQLRDLRSTVATQDAAIAVLADPNHVAAPLAPENGSTASAMAVYLPDTTESYVMATGLAATPAGKVYQLWSADAAGVHPLGTFTFDGNGAFVAPFGVDLSGSAAAMVTLEPAGGSTGEPGPQVVFGELPPASS
jgi:hypothetical protein